MKQDIKKITSELYESPHKERNEDKFGILDSKQCICCMKPMNEDENSKTVHMNENWVAVHNSVTDENCKELTGADSQGTFDIGNSCAKKMPKYFVI